MTQIPILDNGAIRALSDLICGNNLPWYKSSKNLPEYFRSAGLVCKDFDDDPPVTRLNWVIERLNEYQSDPDCFSKELLRIADPREHRGQPEWAADALQRLNAIIAPDGIQAVFKSGNGDFVTTEYESPQEKEAKEASFSLLTVTGLLSNKDFEYVVQSRFDEAQKARTVGAHLSTVIMLGSGLEGLLMGFAESRMPIAMRSTKAPRDETGKTKTLYDWTLFYLIDVAHNIGWIQKDAHAFGQNVRDFRNLVHPNKQWRGRYDSIDEGTCRVCWEVVSVVIDDLSEQINREQTTEMINASIGANI